MKTTINQNTINNVGQFKVNRLVARKSDKPVRHVIMLWNEDSNDDSSMAMATTESKDKWAKKLANKAQFVDIEISRNIMLDDEFLRECALVANY